MKKYSTTLKFFFAFDLPKWSQADSNQSPAEMFIPPVERGRKLSAWFMSLV